MSRLRFVLQPRYQDDANTDRFAFRYQYDNRGLMTSKYVPGGGTTTMAYDDKDSLETSTNGNGKVTYFRDDDLNSVIES